VQITKSINKKLVQTQ